MLHALPLRTIHTTIRYAAVEKSLLGKLRKKTGFSMVNCKKALEINDNNLEKAHEWLRKEAQTQGWAKATKLAERTTAQGLIGIHREGNQAVMVEVNCETDFVARNKEFQSLVNQVAKIYSSVPSNSPENGILKEFTSKEQIESMKTPDGSTLADLAALTIGILGENMLITRAARLTAASGFEVHGYIHPTTPNHDAMLGKYGTIYALYNPNRIVDVPSELGLQITGMNPRSIGCADDPKSEEPDEESVLFHQEYLANPDKTVGEVLEETSIQVLDFIRFECGETATES